MLPQINAAIIGILGLFLPTTIADGDDVDSSPKYLVYPPPGDGAPTKVQLILGLGIPMEGAASTIIGYVLKSNYNLPYNASYYQYTSNELYPDRVKRSTTTYTFLDGRYATYRIIESIFPETGKICLLRAICEAAVTPFDNEGSVFAQLIHVLLTPSSTNEEIRGIEDLDYLNAESIGRRENEEDRCALTYGECEINLLEHISEIY